MAGARAAVERRKASALRSARAASDDAANSFAPSGALPPLILLEAKASWLWSAKLGCGCIARTRSLFLPPPRSGGGGPLELAQRANRGGGGAGLGASFSVQPDYSRGAASFTRKETSKIDDNARRLLSCSVKCCAPSTTPSGWSPSPAIAVADGDYARVAAPDSITLPCPRTCHGIVRRFAGLAS
jgi:hypothetical protein